MVSIRKIDNDYLLFRSYAGINKKKIGQYINITKDDYEFKVRLMGGQNIGYIVIGKKNYIELPMKFVGKTIKLKVEVIENDKKW